jgi:hypothetical protein
LVSSAYDPAHRLPFTYSGATVRSVAQEHDNAAHKLAMARLDINRQAMPPLRQPLIHLAQQHAPMYEEGEDDDDGSASYDSYAQPMLDPARLSTITEQTELRTVDSRSHFGYSPSEHRMDVMRQHVAPPVRNSMRPMSTMTGISASTMDYGTPIRECFFSTHARIPVLTLS